ncbi:MAG TPA: FkbM family methyltransferase [Bryobacteraceae bacterium]|nr:FkbM family methyltransferase [Bryobacteraceae bacterium]
MTSRLRRIVLRANETIAAIPAIARLWVRLVGAVSRPLPNAYLRAAIFNHMASARWPAMELPPREVTPVRGFTACIIPHIGEPDFRALFDRELNYERAVFEWLRERRYRTIFEVGANVGIYTLFLSRLLEPGGKMYAFEPSPEAFHRLLRNLRLNRADDVIPMQCAIAGESGLIRFYEPEGHLTNGSLLRDFAASFDDRVSIRTSLALGGAALGELVESGPVLIKIDAEGAEELILRSMESLIERWRPDIVLEVLPRFEQGLNSISFLRRCGYRFFALTADGPIEQSCFAAGSSNERDYVLVSRDSARPE